MIGGSKELILIAACFAFTCFLLFYSILKGIFLSDKRMQRRMNVFLDLNNRKKLSRHKFQWLLQLRLTKDAVRQKMLSKQQNQKLEHVLMQAGVELKPEEYMIFQWIAACLGAGLLYLISTSPALLLVGAVMGYLGPRIWLKRRRKQRIASFQAGLQDMITTIIGSLRAGFSFNQALKTVAEESPSPIQEEIDWVLRELQYGSSVEEALTNWKERMPSEDLDLMVQAVLIQRQIGGNLAVILETIVRTIRDRSKIQRQIQTLTAQGRLSGMVIGALPIVLMAVIYLIEPSYIGSMFHHPIGIILLSSGAVSGMIGFVFIRKMTKIEV